MTFHSVLAGVDAAGRLWYNRRMKSRIETDEHGNERVVWTLESKQELGNLESQKGLLTKGKVDPKYKARAVKGFQSLLTAAYFPGGDELAEIRKAD